MKFSRVKIFNFQIFAGLNFCAHGSARKFDLVKINSTHDNYTCLYCLSCLELTDSCLEVLLTMLV